MPAKSRYQMVNRGRKDYPYWYVEDTHDNNKCVGCSRKRSHAEGMKNLFNTLEREKQIKLKAGYHLPGL